MQHISTDNRDASPEIEFVKFTNTLGNLNYRPHRERGISNLETVVDDAFSNSTELRSKRSTSQGLKRQLKTHSRKECPDMRGVYSPKGMKSGHSIAFKMEVTSPSTELSDTLPYIHPDWSFLSDPKKRAKDAFSQNDHNITIAPSLHSSVSSEYRNFKQLRDRVVSVPLWRNNPSPLHRPPQSPLLKRLEYTDNTFSRFGHINPQSPYSYSRIIINAIPTRAQDPAKPTIPSVVPASTPNVSTGSLSNYAYHNLFVDIFCALSVEPNSIPTAVELDVNSEFTPSVNEVAERFQMISLEEYSSENN